MTPLLWLAGVAAVGLLALGAFWPTLRTRLIRSEGMPDPLREFAAATLSQGGVMKMAAYHLLLPWVRCRMPRPVVTWLCRKVGAQQGIDFSEIEQPLETFETLDAFFTRGLKSECRPICREIDAVISPADAEVVSVVCIEAGMLLQAKGMPYRLTDLVPIPEAARFVGGAGMVLYLRPRDCHRVFCPVEEARVRSAVYVPGGEMPVSADLRSMLPNLYVHNKRLVQLLETRYGSVAMIMVGAYKVGKMTVEYDRLSSWREREKTAVRHDYGELPVLRRAQWMSTFHLGSTIVLLFEPKRFEPVPELLGREVRYGERIGRVCG